MVLTVDQMQVGEVIYVTPDALEMDLWGNAAVLGTAEGYSQYKKDVPKATIRVVKVNPWCYSINLKHEPGFTVKPIKDIRDLLGKYRKVIDIQEE